MYTFMIEKYQLLKNIVNLQKMKRIQASISEQTKAVNSVGLEAKWCASLSVGESLLVSMAVAALLLLLFAVAL